MILYIQQEPEGIWIVEQRKKKRFKEQHALAYLRELCLCYGCSMEGRRAAVKEVCKIKQKVPVLLSERNKDILFPTAAIKTSSYHWINYRAVKRIKGDQKKTIVLFFDGSSLELDCDVRCVRREMKICERYLHYLETHQPNKV